MDVVRIAVAAALATFMAAPGNAQSVAAWRPIVSEAAARFAIPATWIERVIWSESRGRTTLNSRPITSPAGAMGLMQLMPATWSDIRSRLSLGPDPYAPRDNILAGAFYLRLLYDRFGYPGLFAAYNAGPARYADHLATGRPLPSETRAYLTSVIGARSGAPRVLTVPSPRPDLFFVRHGSAVAAAGPAAPTALFALISLPAPRHDQ